MELNNKRTNIIDVSTPKPLTGCKDSDFQRDNQVSPNIIRVGNDVLEVIYVPDINGNLHKRVVGRTREVIKERYGAAVLNSAPYFQAMAIVPSHTDYRQVVNECWNSYHEIEVKPEKGQHPCWDSLMNRIFGEQVELGWDYLTILYRRPTQVLPILCLVSPENHTGKSTFGNALSYIFGQNVGFFTQDDLNSQFNTWVANLIAVFEEISDTNRSLNKIKAMSTAKEVTVNEKYKPQIKFQPFVKILILSNNEDTFVKAGPDDIRYWVRKLHPLKQSDYIPNFDDKLREEVPAVLYNLSTREMNTGKDSRMWFDFQSIRTDALENVVANSLSQCAKDILIWAEQWEDCYATEMEIYDGLRGRYPLNEVRFALKKELRLKNPCQRYVDIHGSSLNGRAYHIVTEQKNVTLL